MLVVYLLLFSLLHLSSSACGAAGVEGASAARWNRRLLVLLPADVPSSSSSPAAMHAASTSSGEHVRTTTRRLQGRWRPSPAPDVEVRDSAVEGARSGGNGTPRAMTMAPSPRGDDGGQKETAAGGQAGGPQSSSELIITGDGPERNDDIGIDYAAPKTHPPSHN